MKTIVALILAMTATQETAVDRAGHAAESFWQQFTAVQCKERISQTRSRLDGKVLASHFEDFDYVAFLKMSHDGLSVEESRVARPSFPEQVPGTLLTTSGFPTFILMFHPDFRERFEFTEVFAAEPAGLRRIDFKSNAEAQSMSALKLKDHLYPIYWKGTAIVDASSGAVHKIEAVLDRPMDDLGLSELRIEVEYSPAKLAGVADAYWLPARATISLKTPRQAWRNLHEFSEYRRFSVTTSTGNPK